MLDRYLARTGFDSQQTDAPVEEGRPDNLWEPISADQGARGAFGDGAISRSRQLQVTKRRGLLGSLGLAGLAAWAAGRQLGRRRG